MPHSLTRAKKDKGRRGVATVEFACVLPVLIFLTLGTMDLCSVIFLKESAVLAAYEGGRRGVGRGRTNQDVTDRVTGFLDERGINYFADNVVSISDPGFDEATTLENVTVTVAIPTAGNLLIPSAIFGDLFVQANVTLRKEYRNLDN